MCVVPIGVPCARDSGHQRVAPQPSSTSRRGSVEMLILGLPAPAPAPAPDRKVTCSSRASGDSAPPVSGPPVGALVLGSLGQLPAGSASQAAQVLRTTTRLETPLRGPLGEEPHMASQDPRPSLRSRGPPLGGPPRSLLAILSPTQPDCWGRIWKLSNLEPVAEWEGKNKGTVTITPEAGGFSNWRNVSR